MQYRDQYGSPLQEGDFVAFPLALGNAVRGQIVKLDAGLSLDANPQRPPQAFAHVALILDLQAAPNGVVAGIIKAEQPLGATKPPQSEMVQGQNEPPF